MSWQTQMLMVSRVLVNDLESTIYTDNKLETILIVAAFQVTREMNFSQPFLVDLSAMTITPDPTDQTTLDESFVNLVCLKAACLLDRGEARIAAQQGIKVIDGRSSVDLSGIMTGKLALLKSGGWCAVYSEAKKEYLNGQLRGVGAAVLGPFRVWSNGGGYYTPVPGRGRDYLY